MASTDLLAGDGTVREEARVSAVDTGAAWLARRERWLWVLALAALVADVTTTLVGVQFGLAEGNPVVAAALADAGLFGFLTIKAAVLLGAYYFRLVLPRFRVAIPLGVALPWFLAAGANAVLLALAA